MEPTDAPDKGIVEHSLDFNAQFRYFRTLNKLENDVKLDGDQIIIVITIQADS